MDQQDNNSFFEVRACKLGDTPHLLEMYDDFSPKGRFLGMPPKGKETRDLWVKSLLRHGENFMAWRHGKAIGHVVMLPDPDRSDAEYIIFVHQSYRGKGVGTALTRTVINRAGEMRIKRLWLTVDAYNFRAIRLYKKCGFKFCGHCLPGSERMMSYCYEL